MTIAFIGYKNSYSFNKVGGTDAIIRRISNYLSDKNHCIYLLEYDYDKEERVQINSNIIEIRFKTFMSMLKFIKKNKIKHTIAVYIKPVDRLKLYIFRKLNKGLFFHTLITVYHESFFKRKLLFLESSITYNGNKFCVSKRIYENMIKLNKNVVLLFPPVDDLFFKKTKPKKDKIRIGYMGRLDYGKGADLAYYYFFNSNLDREKYEFVIYSYPWKNDSFSLDLHKKLKSQNEIKYLETNLYDDPVKLDAYIANIIDETDVFFLPYRFMSSTIDTPLVILEIMARNTPFVSSKLRTIKDISYSNENLIDCDELNNIDLIDRKIMENIGINVYEKAISLNYKTSEISSLLLRSLEYFNE